MILLLAVDTSGKDGSIALVRGEAGGTSEMLESNSLEGGAFSAQLVPQIAALLSRQGFSKKDIGGFVVVSGPGSFTGLRVGLAAIKALAEVLGKPIATVSLLEAIALVAGIKGRVTAALDAGRQQILRWGVPGFIAGREPDQGERGNTRRIFGFDSRSEHRNSEFGNCGVG